MAIIKTITCHDVYNHGASLQAFALQTFLIDKGHDVEIINYKPWYLSNHFNLLAVNNPKYDKFLIKYVYLVFKLPNRLVSLKRKKTFDRFTATYLKLTKKRYNNNDELKTDCPKADIYIAGSDQIWNTLFENGKDPSFYLDFAPKDAKKISYAASFATSHIQDDLVPFVKSKLKYLDAISTREESGIKILNELGFSGTLVYDPVFLLDSLRWDEIATENYKDKYVLVYDFEKKSKIVEFAKKIAKKNNWKIYSISLAKQRYANKNFVNSSPITFLSLIKNAELVLSNSFHATAFSIIFRKNFYLIEREDGLNIRMRDFLNDLNLSDRVYNYNFENFKIKDIDFDESELVVKTEIRIKESIGFLKMNCI